MQQLMIDYEALVWVITPITTVGIIGILLRKKPYISRQQLVVLVGLLEVLWFIVRPRVMCLDTCDRVIGAIALSTSLNILFAFIAIAIFKIWHMKYA